MPTTNPRINITLDKETAALLGLLAKRQSRSKAAIAKDYIMLGIEQDEDLTLSKLAKARLQSMGKTLTADEFWNQD